MRLLIKYGADPYAENQYGLTLMHVAAQGDASASLYFLKQLGLDINRKDLRNSTPLHWACYSDSETSIQYLLAWGPLLDEQDFDGNTPLHLVVKNIDQFRSTRAIRYLLVKGASTLLRDKKGNTVFDLLGEVRERELA
mmetsp:Transcript_40201/g.29649  ORF Transcript_40201/g.29649 Transcript_40201/m.29649 type:complete len:138 (+) Transcript_40201:564-977(+)